MTDTDALKARCAAARDVLVSTDAMMQNQEFDQAEAAARGVIDELESLIPDPAAGLDHEDPWRTVIQLVAWAYNRCNTVSAARGDLVSALRLARHALTLAERINDTTRMLGLLFNIGVSTFNLGNADGGAEYFLRALEIAEQLDDKQMIGAVFNALGVMCRDAGEFDASEEYLVRGLEHAQHAGLDKEVAAATHNLGTLHKRRGQYAEAARLFNVAMEINERINNREWICLNLGSLGQCYEENGQYDDALKSYTRALDIGQQLGILVDHLLEDLAHLYAREDVPFRDDARAEEYGRRAIEQQRESGVRSIHALLTLFTIQQRQGRYMEAIEALQTVREIERETAENDAQQRLRTWRQQRDLAEQEARESLERAEAAATRNLLDTVLPSTIATRMINGEARIADRYDSVSILFADIVGFTALTQELAAEDVIQILNALFDRFDQIIIDHGCEKVKTIGDGYMAVAGAPSQTTDHAPRLARAAVAMLHAVDDLDLRSINPSMPARLQIRIGLHCGPVIGGVVGRARFVWDVYSDAVNTASRMESTGEPGRIQVSEAFAQELKRTEGSRGEPSDYEVSGLRSLVSGLRERGTVEVKGKGLMTTFWLEGA